MVDSPWRRHRQIQNELVVHVLISQIAVGGASRGCCEQYLGRWCSRLHPGQFFNLGWGNCLPALVLCLHELFEVAGSLAGVVFYVFLNAEFRLNEAAVERKMDRRHCWPQQCEDIDKTQ